MLDLRRVRERPDEVAERLSHRGLDGPGTVERIVELDARRRELVAAGDELRAEQKRLSRQVGPAEADERERLIAEVREVSARLDEVDPRREEVEAELDRVLAEVPNPPLEGVPAGDDDADAVELGRFGQPPEHEAEPRDHVELAEALGMVELERAAKVSGSRFACLTGPGVWLELALVRYALATAEQAGFTPAMPPVLTRAEPLFGTGFLPDGEDQLYEVPRDELYLVGTSEVSLAGLHAGEILDREQLPLRYGGFSTCFRREAGTYGADTRGLFRVHQFDKVEMFSFVRPEDSREEHERLIDLQVDILTGLGLHGRKVDIPAGDLGASAARKVDCEVWLPGEAAYRELTSASNCTDFQARRLRCRYRTADGGTEMVHTLNGTACAVGRTIIALLETHQRADGSVVVPEPLVPALGTEVLAPSAGG